MSRAPPLAAARSADPPAAPRAAAGRLFRQLRRRFREGRNQLDGDAWRRWWIALGAGVVGLAALTVLLVLAARALLARGVLAREADMLVWLANSAPLGFSGAVFVQALGSDLTLLMVIGVTAGLAAWNRRPITALSIIATFIIADLTVRFGWLIWARPRPEIVHGGIAAPGLHAFPSGHTAKALAVYGFLALLWVRASGSVLERICAVVVATLIAVTVGIARLRMGAHWPSDVAAGTVLGAACLAFLGWALRFERPAHV